MRGRSALRRLPDVRSTTPVRLDVDDQLDPTENESLNSIVWALSFRSRRDVVGMSSRRAIGRRRLLA